MRFMCVFGRHMSKWRSDWLELLGMASQGIGPKIPDHPFRIHFVSGSGGMGMGLSIASTDKLRLMNSWLIMMVYSFAN